MVIVGIRSITYYTVAGQTYDAVMGSNKLLEMVDVEGVCTKVSKVEKGKTNYITGYNAYVTYEYNGKKYEDVLIEHYEITLKKGDKVDLKVVKDAPAICTIDYPFAYYNYYKTLSYVIFAVGIVFVIIFFALWRKEKYY